MKTFKQWFNSLSEETQKYLIKNCTWIDLESKDYYRHPDKKKLDTLLKVKLDEVKKSISEDGYYRSSTTNQQLGIIITQQHKDTLDHESYMYILTALTDNVGCNTAYCDAFDLREMVKAKHDRTAEYNKDKSEWSRRKDTYSLSEKLLIMEDFSTFDWSDTDVGDICLDDVTAEILGHDEVIRRAKENPRCFTIRGNYRSFKTDNSIFDELFFCADGWTKEQKDRIIHDYDYDMRGVEDFMKRIVSVDESYLRYIGTYFIRNCPALGMHLYKQKKSQEEIDALPLKHRQEDEYRYSKSYRKLFQIAACCARENVGKAMAGTIGDISGILKMYSYNFNQIFDCLYPQYAEAPEADPPETVAV